MSDKDTALWRFQSPSKQATWQSSPGAERCLQSQRRELRNGEVDHLQAKTTMSHSPNAALPLALIVPPTLTEVDQSRHTPLKRQRGLFFHTQWVGFAVHSYGLDITPIDL